MASTMNIGKYYYADVKVLSTFDIIFDIYEKLMDKKDTFSIVSKSCFGSWFYAQDCRTEPCLLHFMLSNLVKVDKVKEELVFEVAGTKLHFGPEQFCLITGMKFGVLPRIPGRGGGPFLKRLFGKAAGVYWEAMNFRRRKSYVCVKDIHYIFNNYLSGYTDSDIARICLLELLHIGFLNGCADFTIEDEILRLVDDLDAWNNFPWGSYIWRPTFESLCESRQYSNVSYYPKIPKKDPKYRLEGFMFAFKIWIFEVLPYSRVLCKKDGLFRVPRGIAWNQEKDFGWLTCVDFDKMSTQAKYRPKDIQATHLEKERPWYQDTMRFLKGANEDLDSLLAKFQKRFNLKEGGQEEMQFGNIEQLLDVLWKKAYPDEEMHGDPMIDDEFSDYTEEDWTQLDKLFEIATKKQPSMMDEDVDTSGHKVTPPPALIVPDRVFEATALEFYQSATAGGYLRINNFPYDLDRKFWGILLNQRDDGWLEDEHIDIWCNMVALSPLKDQRCGILPVLFHKILEDCQRIYDLANGTEGPCPPWWTLDRVLFPLNQPNVHWMVAELDMTSWVVTIYDSRFQHDPLVPTPRTRFLQGIHDKLQQLIPQFLDKLDYWEKAGVSRVNNLQVNMDYDWIDAPQQSDGSSCGIYTCHFIEKLAHCQSIHLQCPTEVFEKSYREFMTSTIYSTRCG